MYFNFYHILPLVTCAIFLSSAGNTSFSQDYGDSTDDPYHGSHYVRSPSASPIRAPNHSVDERYCNDNDCTQVSSSDGNSSVIPDVRDILTALSQNPYPTEEGYSWSYYGTPTECGDMSQGSLSSSFATLDGQASPETSNQLHSLSGEEESLSYMESSSYTESDEGPSDYEYLF